MAMLVTAVGVTLMVPNVVALVGLGALSGVLEMKVRLVDEPYLSATNNFAYEQYAARVGRFLPAWA